MELGQLSHITGIARSLIRDHKITTPFLIINEERVEQALLLFEKHLPDVELFYAIKANPALNLIQYFVDKGLSLDVASAGEIETAVTLGVPGSKLFLSTPIKTIETIDAMFRHEIAYCAVDTAEEIDRILAFRQERDYSHAPKIFVRIRIESKNVEVDLNTKFGCPLGEAINVVERAVNLGFELGGISFHVGTQCTNADNYFLGIESAMLVAKEALRRFNVHLPAINIGGGFCDPVTAADAGINLADFYANIGTACKEATDAGFKVYAEPGRCLVSAAGSLVTSVIGTNIRNEHRWVYLDDGIYGCYSIKSYEKHKFEFHCVNPVHKARSVLPVDIKGTWTVAGPTCDSLDVIAEAVELPINITHGDLLLTPNMGAYSISTACNFNGFNSPRCYIAQGKLKGGKVHASIRTSNFGQGSQIAANS